MNKEPSIISYLKTCSTDPKNELSATIKGTSCIGLGTRPRILDYGEDGMNVYGLSGKQVAKVLKTYDEVLKFEQENRAK